MAAFGRPFAHLRAARKELRMEVHRSRLTPCFHEPFLRLTRGIGTIGLVLELVAASGGLEAPLKHLLVEPSPSISFVLRMVDGWNARVMQGFRLFSGAGSTGGWNEWDRCLGGRDQG